MNPTNETEVFETTLLKCWFGDDGILYSVSKVAERTIENYNSLFELYKKLSNNGENRLCTLGNVSKTRPLNKEVRDYISKELPKYIKAMALISDTPLGKEISKIFIAVNPQSYVRETFDNKEEAIQWLKQYL